jgi:hypothetical protein
MNFRESFKHPCKRVSQVWENSKHPCGNLSQSWESFEKSENGFPKVGNIHCAIALGFPKKMAFAGPAGHE